MSDISRALQEALAEDGDKPGMLGDWVLVYEVQNIEPDSEDMTYRVGTYMSTDPLPIHRILGLLETAKAYYAAKAASGGEER